MFAGEPVDAVAGAAISSAIGVTIVDVLGDIVSAARDAVTLSIRNNPGGSTVSGTVTVNAIGGIATFPGISLDKIGIGYDLEATSGALVPDTSIGFGINPAAPAKLTFTVDASDAEGNTAFSTALAIGILDRFDNLTAATDNITVTLGINPWRTVVSGGGGSLVGTTTVAAVAGVATFTSLGVDNPATGYTVIANSGSLPDAESAPFDISLTVQSVSTGDEVTCATTAGGAYCWGTNSPGVLGRGSGFSGRDSVPGLVLGSQGFSQVSVQVANSSGRVVCALDSIGAAHCWGDNSQGQLGDGNSPTDRDVPVAVSGGLSFATVSVGEQFACGVTTTGAGYCWGDNSNGQLGDGNSPTDSDVPVAVSGGLTFSTIATGEDFACGIVTNGDVYCWGDNGSGQLGDANSPTDTNVPVLVSGGLTYSSLQAGGDHACGVVANADAYCWGENNWGQLGDGNSPTDSNVPVLVSGGLSWSDLGAGFRHTCGVTTTGVAYCWGDNGTGQLGDDNAGTNSDTRVAVLGGLTFSSISVGDTTSCGLTTGGDLYCWGRNNDGQVGDGTRTARSTPVRVIH